MKTLYVLHHLGLGDHFVCNGLVRFLRTQYLDYQLILLCQSRNLPTVSAMYSDDTNISFAKVDSQEQIDALIRWAGSSIIQVGTTHNSSPTLSQAWDKIFYEHANIDFEQRYLSFKIARNAEREQSFYQQLNPSNAPYIFINDSGSTGKFKLQIQSSVLHIHTGFYSDNLLDWLLIIEHAKEIHTIDSAFLCLIDHLDLSPDIELFYHTIRGTPAPTLRKNWTIVDYPKSKRKVWKKIYEGFVHFKSRF